MTLIHPLAMTETETLLGIIRLVVGVAILSYASYTDIKSNEHQTNKNMENRFISYV